MAVHVGGRGPGHLVRVGGAAAALPASLTLSSSSRPAATLFHKIAGTDARFQTENSGVVVDSANTTLVDTAGGRMMFSGATKNVVMLGDSLTQGGGAAPPAINPLDNLITRLYFEKSVVAHYKNCGIPYAGLIYTTTTAGFGNGQTMIQKAPAFVDPALDGSLENWLVIWLGTNDIVLGGQTGAAVYSALQTCLDARIAAGWPESRIIVCTMVARAGNAPDTALNTAIRGKAKAGGGTYSYQVADFGAMTQFDAGADTSNTTYYQADGTHLTSASALLLGASVRGIIAP